MCELSALSNGCASGRTLILLQGHYPMASRNMRKESLNRFIDLARVYRGWDRTQLAERLGTNPEELLSEDGNPSLEFIVALAGALDWPIGEVAETIWGHANGVDHQPKETFSTLDGAARKAHRAGEYREMVQYAQRMAGEASTPRERATACNREAGGWDGLGRYTKVLEVLQRGLQEPGITPGIRLMLHANLANAHYTLWHLLEAKSTARELIEQFRDTPPESRLERVSNAFALYVRGNSARRLIAFEPPRAAEHACRAKADLRKSRHLYLQLAEEFDDESYGGVANTCQGALMEVEVELGILTVEQAVTELARGITTETAAGDWLESRGWWCIFGCNVALRHMQGKDLNRNVGIFTSRAFQIADELNNWAMRERAFTMEHFRRKRFADETGDEADWVIDDSHVQILAGTMSRFPSFRGAGWDILRNATVKKQNTQKESVAGGA